MIIVSYGAKNRTLAQAVSKMDMLGKHVMTVDARKLPNPHSVPDLRGKTGLDPEVREWLWDKDGFTTALKTVVNTFKTSQNSYEAIFVCCYGGRHRSVCLVEELANIFESLGHTVSRRHLELEE